MVLNVRDDFDMCMKDAEDKVGKRGYDTARMNCVNNYKSELKKQVPNLN